MVTRSPHKPSSLRAPKDGAESRRAVSYAQGQIELIDQTIVRLNREREEWLKRLRHVTVLTRIYCGVEEAFHV